MSVSALKAHLKAAAELKERPRSLQLSGSMKHRRPVDRDKTNQRLNDNSTQLHCQTWVGPELRAGEYRHKCLQGRCAVLSGESSRPLSEYHGGARSQKTTILKLVTTSH